MAACSEAEKHLLKSIKSGSQNAKVELIKLGEELGHSLLNGKTVTFKKQEKVVVGFSGKTPIYEYHTKTFTWNYSRNSELALVWIEKAIEQGSEGAKKLKGVALYNAADYKNRKNDQVNRNSVISKIQQSAELGYDKAQALLGELYLSGEAFPANISTVLQWLQKAADQNNSRAQYLLGKMYFDGKLVTADQNLAIRLLEKAEGHDNADARKLLASIKHLSAKEKLNSLDETEKRSGMGSLIESAKLGNVDAQIDLAGMYLKGSLVDKDLLKSKSWLEQANELGANVQAKLDDVNRQISEMERQRKEIEIEKQKRMEEEEERKIRLAETVRKKELARIEKIHQEEIAKNKKEREAYIGDLKSGNRPMKSFSDAVMLYEPKDGLGLMFRSGSAWLDSFFHFLSGSLAVKAYAAFCIAGRLSK